MCSQAPVITRCSNEYESSLIAKKPNKFFAYDI